MAGRDEKVDAWMPLYVRDILAATEHLAPANFGAYVRLLCHLWLEHGYLDDDGEHLRRLAHVTRRRWPSTWAVLARFFELQGGRLSQRRLLHELEQARELRRVKSQAGRKGAAARWGDAASQDATATVLPLAKNGSHHTSPSPAPDQTGRGEDSSSSGAPGRRATPAEGSEVLLTFPTVPGRRSGEREWHLTKSAAAELQDGFPNLDVVAEARKARAWILTHEAQRKTARGMKAFLFGWLSRSQNHGGGRTGTPAAPPTAAPPKTPPPELCSFHREILDRASSDPYAWCTLCRKFGARSKRNGVSEPEPIGRETGHGGSR